jgi:hypothetical protein
LGSEAEKRQWRLRAQLHDLQAAGSEDIFRAQGMGWAALRKPLAILKTLATMPFTMFGPDRLRSVEVSVLSFKS